MSVDFHFIDSASDILFTKAFLPYQDYKNLCPVFIIVRTWFHFILHMNNSAKLFWSGHISTKDLFQKLELLSNLQSIT